VVLKPHPMPCCLTLSGPASHKITASPCQAHHSHDIFQFNPNERRGNFPPYILLCAQRLELVRQDSQTTRSSESGPESMVAHDVDIEGNGNIRGISLSKSEGLHVPSISASTHAGEDETNIPATQSSPEPDGLDENSNAELRENGFIKLNTHDTSFVEEHIPDIEKFAQDLQQAINAAWSDRKRNRYQEVHVLLLSWEDDNMGVFREIERLRYVFSNLYRFDVQEFRIPGKTPQKAATVRLSSFLEKDGPSSLLIVYYAGHARLGPQSSAPPIWAA